MPHRLRTRDELLAAWRAQDVATTAARNARAEAEAAATLDTSRADADRVLRVWAAQTLRLELAAGQDVPCAVVAAFARAQAALWDGEPISDPALLVDEPGVLTDTD